MNKLKRRKFLNILLTSSVAGGLGLWRNRAFAQAPDHAAHSGTQGDASDAFVNPLRLPGDRGLFGILTPSSSLGFTAKPILHQVLPGRKTWLWAYEVKQDGKTYLNPIIRVRRGSTFHAALRNALSEETIIHWHGMHVDDKNDAHPGYAIPYGEQYAYAFPVINRAATYWYHPHPHHLTAGQTYAGLASLFIVEDEEELALQVALDLKLGKTDIPLIIQDRRFDKKGVLRYAPTEQEEFHGHLGDSILANLTPNPYLDVAPRIYRFRILNASNARVYRLAFMQGDKALDYHLIGNDGGLLERPHRIQEVFVAPAERVDLLLDLSKAKPGDTVFLKSLPFDPMHVETEPRTSGEDPHAGHGAMAGLPDGAGFDILKLNLKYKVRFNLNMPDRLSRITPIRTEGASTRTMMLDHLDMKWRINGWVFDMNATPVVTRRDTVEIWEVQNSKSSMPHPMHIHGFQFQMLERRNSPQQVGRLAVNAKGLIPSDLGWKDTVLVWPGETVRFAVDFTHSFPGEQVYMFHCHNLEHEDQGMMINYKIV